MTGMAIVTASGAPLTAAAGDAIPLEVVLTLSNGKTAPLPMGTEVTWTQRQTIVAQDPNDAGPSGILPTFGADPTGIFVQNPFSPDRTDYAGTLFVIDPGTGSTGTLTVTASVADAGLSASFTVSPTPAGDPDAGADLFQNRLNCAGCHGPTGGGSPPSAGPDGGNVYVLQGTAYPYPAPGLNNTSPGGSPNLAADPGWNAALLGMAARGRLGGARRREHRDRARGRSFDWYVLNAFRPMQRGPSSGHVLDVRPMARRRPIN